MKDKVIFVISALSGGGAERVMTNVANEMVNRGITVKILKTGSKSEDKYELNNSIEIIQVPKISTQKLTKAIRMILFMRKTFIRYSDYTIISFLSDNNMLTIAATTALKNKVVICERNDPSKNCGNAILRCIRNKLYLLADWNVFQTEDAKNYFSKRIRNKGTIIPNPIVINEDIQKNNSADTYVVAAGRLTPQKNYKMLIDSYELFSKTHKMINLRIFGEGPEKSELQNYIDERGLSDKVTIFPFTANIHQQMINSCMYVSSSKYEGISNTMLESLALGVPTLVTDCPVGGARLAIDNWNNGIYVPVDDVQAMSDAMCKIVDDLELNIRLRKNAVLIKERYSINTITDMWIDVL